MAAEGSPIIYRNLLHWVETYQPASWSLRGAHMIEPVSQGEYDGLCGLYCIINAIRLVAAPHRPVREGEVRALFQSGVNFIARHGNLATAVGSCVGERLWPKLATSLGSRAHRLTGLNVHVERPGWVRSGAPVADVFSLIETLITSGKAPMLFMRGKYRHYSVISGYTPSSFRLFDSFGYHWVRRESCGISNTGYSSLHRFHVQSMLIMWADRE